MSELEDRINSVLSDPAQLEKLAGLAQRLMGGADAPSAAEAPSVPDAGLLAKLAAGLRGSESEPGRERALLAAMDGTGAEPFVYTCDTGNPVDGDPLVTYYRRIGNGAMRRFRDERVNQYKKPFRVFGEPEELERGGEVVYFCVIGPEGLIRETAREAERVPGVSLTAYPDAYEPWVWYLEIFPETASKRHAVEFLRSWTGADFVVAFGDNRNDIPMFEAADFAVAVSSASEEVKAKADAETDSVTEFIERLAGLA